MLMNMYHMMLEMNMIDSYWYKLCMIIGIGWWWYSIGGAGLLFWGDLCLCLGLGLGISLSYALLLSICIGKIIYICMNIYIYVHAYIIDGCIYIYVHECVCVINLLTY